jgi:hypothetical protein
MESDTKNILKSTPLVTSHVLCLSPNTAPTPAKSIYRITISSQGYHDAKLAFLKDHRTLRAGLDGFSDVSLVDMEKLRLFWCL